MTYRITNHLYLARVSFTTTKSTALLAWRLTEHLPIGASEARGILEATGNCDLAHTHGRVREQALPSPQPHAAVVCRGRHAGMDDKQTTQRIRRHVEPFCYLVDGKWFLEPSFHQ